MLAWHTRAIRGAFAFVVLGLVVLGWREHVLSVRVQSEAEALEAVAAEAAALMESGSHERVRAGSDASGDTFQTLRASLRAVEDRHGLRSPMYTLRPTPDVPGMAQFVIMTNETPFVGDRVAIPAEAAVALRDARRATSGLYRSDRGWWISGWAPILDAGGRAVAIVEADRPSEDLANERTRGILFALLAGALGVLGAWAETAISSARSGPLAFLRRLVAGHLSTRIGLSGALAVVIAIGIASVLDTREARRDLIEYHRERLLATVRLGARLVDPADHIAVATSGDATSEPFLRLRSALRSVKEAADLSTPVYTLQRNGGLTRFVGMTNEVPFVGDSNELRPGLLATFEGAGPGFEGPYSDAHGTWLSAWAPIEDADGGVVGVLQADHEVGALLIALQNRALEGALFALAGIAVAFVAAAMLARNIARPIGDVARAAGEIERGRFDVALPEDRIDEVGELCRATNRMAQGLAEREKLRDMFGKYMATQVLQDLLSRGKLTLSGEVREITVLITDIRGYTSLTEKLGAEEVVALLNEYFAILLEVLIEHDGVIDKFMGDAMLCWFGAPAAMPEHRAQAVKAASRIMDRLAEWNLRRAERGLPPVATGVGIASGRVVVGNIGSALHMEYTAIGDAVNLASRLCGKAAAGEVIVTDEVRRATPDDRFREVGRIEVKGVSEPVLVHRMSREIVATA